MYWHGKYSTLFEKPFLKEWDGKYSFERKNKCIDCIEKTETVDGFRDDMMIIKPTILITDLVGWKQPIDWN